MSACLGIFSTPTLSCDALQDRLSDYLDGVMTGVEMRGVADHLANCPACASDLEAARTLQHSLATLGTARPPADLSLRLRLAISHERQRGWSSRLDALRLQWNNALRPLALQLSAGLAATIVLLGGILFLVGAVGGANPVMANDEPLGAITAPHYLYSVSGIQPIVSPQDDTIIVEAAVNARGEVYDYHIVSGPVDPSVRIQVINRLLSSVFRPASVFGSPVRGHIVMTFSGVSVHG